jgi:hypothetical protein
MVFDLFLAAMTITFTVAAMPEEFNQAAATSNRQPEGNGGKYEGSYGRRDLDSAGSQAQIGSYAFACDLFASRAHSLRSAQNSSFLLGLKNTQRAEPEENKENEGT